MEAEGGIRLRLEAHGAVERRLLVREVRVTRTHKGSVVGAVDGPADAVDVLEVGAARACRGREVRGRERAGLPAVAGQAERCRDELEVGDGVGELGVNDGLIRESEGANDVPATRPEDGAVGQRGPRSEG